MTPRCHSLVLGAVLAVGIPGLALARAPFGGPALLIVHLAATLPLALLLALRARWAVARPWAIPWALAGAVAWWVSEQAAPAVGAWLDQREAGFTPRLLVRVLWSLGLQLPWWLRGACLLPPAPRPRGSALAVVLALAFAVALPAAFADYLIREQERKLEELRAGMPLPRLLAVVQGLCELGVKRTSGGEELSVLRRQ